MHEGPGHIWVSRPILTSALMSGSGDPVDEVRHPGPGHGPLSRPSDRSMSTSGGILELKVDVARRELLEGVADVVSGLVQAGAGKPRILNISLILRGGLLKGDVGRDEVSTIAMLDVVVMTGRLVGNPLVCGVAEVGRRPPSPSKSSKSGFGDDVKSTKSEEVPPEALWLAILFVEASVVCVTAIGDVSGNRVVVRVGRSDPRIADPRASRPRSEFNRRVAVVPPISAWLIN